MNRTWPVLVLLCVVMLAGYLIPELRSIRHGSIAIVLLLAILTGGVRVRKPKFILAFSTLMLYGLLVSFDNISLLSFKFFLLFFSPLVSAFILTSSIPGQLERFLRLFYIISVVFQVVAIAKVGKGITTLGIFQMVGAKETSSLFFSTSSEIENSFGFIFGYFGLFFLTKRERWNFLICLFLFILNYKRIVLGGFIMAAAYYFYAQLRSKSQIPFKPMIIGAPFILLAILIEVGSGNLNQAAMEMTGRTMNHLTTGRYATHHALYDSFFELPELAYGYGVGFSSSVVRTYDFTKMTLVHSDYLMLMYDFGFIGFIIFFILFFRNFLHNSNQAVYIIFFLMVLIFDNTIIYFDVMFLLYLLLIYETEKSHLVLSGQPA